MRRLMTGMAAIVIGANFAASGAAAMPAPPPRPADLAPALDTIPLPPPRPAEFSHRGDFILPPWRPLRAIHQASLGPRNAPRLVDTPGLTLRFAAPPPASSPSSSKATAEELAACDALFASRKVGATRLPAIAGPEGCGVGAPVSLERVTLADGRSIRLEPPAVMRCALAAAAANWLADSVIPAMEQHGGRVASLVDAGGYQCRNRNNASEGKLSEHAHGDALDLVGARFEDGHVLNFSALDNELITAQALRDTACASFATVLGPGADGAHEGHIHVDLVARRHGARLCEWNLR